IIRCKCKEIVRLMYKMVEEGIEIDVLLFEIFNLLANLFFQLALEENKKSQVPEIIFNSKSY
ncbi:MAG: ATP--cob(I)alamin adenosyltransferase, partial [Bacilli bacterium]